MIESIIAFAGSATVRWILGEGIAFFKQRQDRKLEMEMLTLNHEHEKDRRQWEREALATAQQNQIELIREQGAGKLDEIGALMQKSAVDTLFTKSGVLWVDAWNSSIRPFLATCAILLLVFEAFFSGVKIEETTRAFLFSALGIFVGGRIQQVGR